MSQTLNLNGPWEAGLNRQYDRQVQVPGLATDPGAITPGTLWYRRKVALPHGRWTHATLILNGARFRPQVYVNGDLVSASEGGMTVTLHPLLAQTASTGTARPHAAIIPGDTITLEIALAPLSDVPAGDASRIPEADQWRTNISSCLWDDVTLHLADAPLTRLPPVAPVRRFRVEGKRFFLDHQPIQLRAATVVWHRWCRDPEASTIGAGGLAWDEKFFETHIIERLKAHGANALRFHLGLPPERFLSLCDKHGLLVQAEWSFFHNMDGHPDSLRAQYRAALDMLSRHPSVVLFHAWNEHEGPEIEAALEVLREIRPEYPHMAFSYLEVMHPHKYWWSLFENVGVYYDSADEFPLAIMVDEFGGNYLDGDGNPGAYPTVKESMLRFLGKEHTRQERLELHALSNARVAEYWRRLLPPGSARDPAPSASGGGDARATLPSIGPAGFSPFAICGSPEDGNHWFIGPLKDGRPKPVWDALTAAWSPRSVSLDLWDRNFEPGEKRTVNLHLFNDTDSTATLGVRVGIGAAGYVESSGAGDEGGDTMSHPLPPHTRAIVPVEISLPPVAGLATVRAELSSGSPGVTRPVVSAWPVHVISPCRPASLGHLPVCLLEPDQELEAFRTRFGLRSTAPRGARVLVTSAFAWQHLPAYRAEVERALLAGTHVLMLDIGPRPLGEGYPDAAIIRNLQGQPRVTESVEEVELFLGLKVRFRRTPEPESCIHPAEAPESALLWHNLPRSATQLWNGLRGGLIVPATDMELTGLAREALVELWASRGAEAAAIAAGRPYFTLELAGFYAFGPSEDRAARDALRTRVKFLVDDAPALAMSINPAAPIRSTDLAALYEASGAGQARRLTPLVAAGKNLTRSPVVKVDFAAPGSGSLILSQLLTAGRLAPGFAPPTRDAYPLRYDPAASQFVLNLLASF